MIGELTHPCFVPILHSNYLVKPSPTLTQDVNCPYIDLKIHKNLLSSLLPFRSTYSTRDYSMNWLVVWQCKCGKIIWLPSNTTSFFKVVNTCRAYCTDLSFGLFVIAVISLKDVRILQFLRGKYFTKHR